MIDAIRQVLDILVLVMYCQLASMLLRTLAVFARIDTRLIMLLRRYWKRRKHDRSDKG
ncbi:hypothetical protein KQI65_15960 [bacterium]|nr:hypothetical protein [bacterium]